MAALQTQPPAPTRAPGAQERNPWLAASPAPAADQIAPAAPSHAAAGGYWLRAWAQQDGEDQAPASGPATPQPAAVVWSPGRLSLPQRRHLAQACPWWVGAHGGAGESTLADLLPGSAAADHAWPTAEDGHPLAGAQAPAAAAVLVARTSAAGLLRAQEELTRWAGGGLPGVRLLGLALLADAPGRLPPALRHLADLVAGGAPRCWRVPWVEGWRTSEPEPRRAPPTVRRLCVQVVRLTAATT